MTTKHDVSKMKVLIVFGTRPEAIKMVPVIRAFEEDRQFETKVCVTAQHREMLDQVLKLFDIIPDFDLDIMKPGQDLFDITANVLTGMRNVLNAFTPDLVLVHGDTTTTIAATLAGFYQKIHIGHVEAGLRTGNLYSPWPEEANRQLTGRLATWHFAPTENNKENLLRENISPDRIIVTGNTVIDTLLYVKERLEDDPSFSDKAEKQVADKGYRVTDKRMVLITGHRRENFGEGFLNICHALKSLAMKYEDVDFRRHRQYLFDRTAGLSSFCLFAQSVLFCVDRQRRYSRRGSVSRKTCFGNARYYRKTRSTRCRYCRIGGHG